MYNNERKNDVDNRSVLGTEKINFFAITNMEKICHVMGWEEEN